VFGDSSATLAGALAASRLGIPVAHVDAGLRSFDRRTPDEMNRVLADAMSEWLFTSERESDVNLRAEGITDQKILFVGSTTIDTMIRYRSTVFRLRIVDMIGFAQLYVVVALSKPYNVDHAPQLRSIAYALLTLADQFDVACPVSPHVMARFGEAGLAEMLADHRRVRLVPTTGYLEFLGLLTAAAGVITDSSSLQQEALVIGIPCVTLCRYTKHRVTLAHGGNRLAGGDPHLAVRYVREAVNARAGFAPIPEGWDGHAAVRIVDAIERDLAHAVNSAKGALPVSARDRF